MKKLALFFAVCAILIGCSKKAEDTRVQTDQSENVTPYDTIAIDSFSEGATPNNVIIKRDTLPKVVKDTAKATPKKGDEKTGMKAKGYSL